MPNAIFHIPPDALASAGFASPEMRGRIDGLDWAKTRLGPIAGWTETLRGTVRLMLAAAAPMVLLAGRDGVLIYNDAYAAFAGQKHPSILGLPAEEAFPEIAEFNRDVLARGFRGETLSLKDQELPLNRSGEAEPAWMDLEYAPVPGPEGVPEGVLVIVHETTARVKAQRALSASEERLAIALEAAAVVGTWDRDIGTGIVTGDARFAAMSGVSAAQAAQGFSVEAHEGTLHPDDLPTVRRAVETALETGGRYFAEYRLAREGAADFWVQATGRVAADADGRPARLSGVVIDISERKRGETAVAASEAKFRALADAMPQMVWSALPDGFHDYYNARWYAFTGVPAGSTDGEEWNGVFHPDDRAHAWELWRRSLRTGEPYEIEYRLRHRSGEYRWTLGRALPVTDAGGRIIRWFGTCTDIHEAKLAAEEREVVAQELSHRIKNIFSVLNSIIALSARSFPGAKPFADQLKRRIFAMGQAHDFVRPHSAASRPAAAQTSLKSLTERLLAPFAGPDGESVRFAGEDATIDDAAATPLALLFHELATNAAKYGALGTGGNVTLTGRHSGESYLLEWKERGGPAVTAPAEAGFGTRLIGLSVEGQLGGAVRRAWEPDGLRVELELPRAALRRSGRLAGAAPRPAMEQIA